MADLEDLKKLLGDDGFSFSCKSGCSACCRGEGIVYFSLEDLKRIGKYLKYSPKKIKQLQERIAPNFQAGYYHHDANDACFFLDEAGRCSVYDVRPMQCSSYPFWPSFFGSFSDLKFLRRECPGTEQRKDSPYKAEEVLRLIRNTEIAFLIPQAQNGDQPGEETILL